jgi:cytochrome b561
MLWAIALRIAVRIFTPSPEPVAQLNHQQRKHAKLGHFGLYAALVTMPLSGWLMVSASPFGLPTLVFVEWINWPHIPGVARNKAIESIANTVHWVTASTLLVLVIGHVSAVVWHKKAHKINLVKRMWWSKNV